VESDAVSGAAWAESAERANALKKETREARVFMGQDAHGEEFGRAPRTSATSGGAASVGLA
jgi:hypothetical protein